MSPRLLTQLFACSAGTQSACACRCACKVLLSGGGVSKEFWTYPEYLLLPTGLAAHDAQQEDYH